MFLQLSGIAPTDSVTISEPLDTNSIFPAAPKKLNDTSCFSRRG
jgi:hypothetical protein